MHKVKPGRGMMIWFRNKTEKKRTGSADRWSIMTTLTVELVDMAAPRTKHHLTVHHFLAAVTRARFNLSISCRSEAEHLERTAPISESFLRSMAASAAPSKSLKRREEELAGGQVSPADNVTGVSSYLTARWALTFCSGVTLETYFLASYLLLYLMQISTKAWKRHQAKTDGKCS